MKRLALIFIIMLLTIVNASAASRFWVPLTITNAVSGTGGLCRLTVNNTANLVSGTPVIVAGILGATACDGTTTVTTVVSSTIVEVNLAFGLAYTSGGTVAGGQWTSTGIGNWSATTGGAGGQTVPTSADTVTFDGASGGGTVTLNFGGTITIQSLTLTAFVGTFDNSVNNNNITMTSTGGAFNVGGSSVKTVNLGTATYTLSGGAAGAGFSDSSMTLNATGSTIAFTGAASGIRTLNSVATVTLGTVSFSAISGAGLYQFTGSINFTGFNITAPNFFQLTTGAAYTITNAFNWAG